MLGTTRFGNRNSETEPKKCHPQQIRKLPAGAVEFCGGVLAHHIFDPPKKNKRHSWFLQLGRHESLRSSWVILGKL